MTSSRRSELELFDAIAGDGDQSSVEEFSERLRRCAHWVLNRMSRGHDLRGEVDEIVDDARFRLEQLRGRGFTGGDREFRSYLYKVVVSACVEAANRRRRTSSLDAPVTLPDGDERPLGEVVQEMVAPGLAAHAALERGEEVERVRRALERLDPRCRNLLRGFHLEERSINELASALGRRPNAVEVALTRCRQRLYAAFLSVYIEGGDRDLGRRVGEALERLSAPHRRVFGAWWAENRSVADISKEIGATPAETREMLGKAKVEVWRLVGAGAAG